MSKEKQTCHSL